MEGRDLANAVNGLIEEGEALRRVRAASSAWARLGPAGAARVFHFVMAAAFLLTTFAGFGPTYFLRGFSDRPPLDPLFHLHGLVFTSWLLLLLAQTTLVARNRVDWHRRLGIAGAGLSAVMVIVGIMAAIASARHGIVPGGLEPLVF
ncbi:MAG: hypothetical protein GEU82_06895 [Luteitalea sp.]|nr:hypothetical protein [Luteitalea sp.]